MKQIVIILALLLGVAAAAIIARFVFRPVNAMATSTRDDQVAAELRSELSRIYLKSYAYPKTLDAVWTDPEFIAILEQSFLSADRSNIFNYASSGETYSFTYTNGAKLVIERGLRGIPSRDVINVGDPIPPPPADPLATTSTP